MDAQTLDDLVTTWITGWSQSRSYQPRRDGRAFVIDRHDADEAVEKLIVCPSRDEFQEHAASLDGVRRFTVITDNLADTLAAAAATGLSPIEGTETLMVTEIQEHDVERPLPPGDGIEHEYDRPEDGVITVSVTVGGRPAASGTVSVVDTVAVFDRIITEPDFRRKGLASYVMRLLTHAALDADVETGLLVASPQGLLLYQYLGWTEVASIPVFTPTGA